jgi:uncharacterized RDD family membrane protein YckC
MDAARQPFVTAGFGYRVAAFLFDLGLALAALTAALLAGLSSGAALIAGLAVWVFVTSVAGAVFDGQSLGKRLAGTRVITARGAPVGFGKSLLRDTLARLLYLVPLFFVVDSVFAAASEDGRTLRTGWPAPSWCAGRRRPAAPGAWRLPPPDCSRSGS